MSVLVEAYGDLVMTTEKGASRVREYLVKSEWLQKTEDGLFWDGWRSSPTPSKGRTIVFSGGIQDNLGRAIEHILENPEEFGYLEESSSLRVISTDMNVCAYELSLRPVEEGFIGKMILLSEKEIEEAVGFDFRAYKKACEEALDHLVLANEEMKLGKWALSAWGGTKI